MPGIARKIFVWALIVVTVSSASAQPAIQPTADITKVPVAAQPSPHFDADAATETYSGSFERLLRGRLLGLLAHSLGLPYASAV
jgi:hypothetical protein